MAHELIVPVDQVIADLEFVMGNEDSLKPLRSICHEAVCRRRSNCRNEWAESHPRREGIIEVGVIMLAAKASEPESLQMQCGQHDVAKHPVAIPEVLKFRIRKRCD